ncbi:aspartyl/glutamyl-tRNA(Asn/Gln) amidotransferase subunit B [Rhizobium phage RL38J1]|uniref:Aspartyl/glutamyl-tRNA(Asn/Gln) amidotransferase subunit B n=1 Tax=Rhizobium phage RL38J1 TaxID=2663232 RepID=A0A6B9J1A4_9CAUD|nr:aspartyl/glutamyl-tRNA(Asn/Gln) amidotransferase subunit B [Rhizobium phage RL38J1]QGZ13994.1 aspartyl/glutamyl-tRNA(Asn/Gln) amidotransferase subunit B [Rhizobium phage RL38J1]
MEEGELTGGLPIYSDVEYLSKVPGMEPACKLIEESDLIYTINRLIVDNPDKTKLAKDKPMLAGWFIGQVMKEYGGKPDPTRVTTLVQRYLFGEKK